MINVKFLVCSIGRETYIAAQMEGDLLISDF